MTIKELVETLGMFDEEVPVVIGPGLGRGPARAIADIQAQIEGALVEAVILVPATAVSNPL